MDLRLGVIQPTGEIAGILANVDDGRRRSFLDPLAICRADGASASIPVISSMQQTELGVLPDVVRHRKDGLA